ncbi:MAG: M20 family metallopeptidase [Bacteroidales bacterium]|nr:M20 family metallopeptidase [Bacteroidales bacterium]
MIDIKDKIKQLAQEYYNDVIAIRRHLHQNPELSFEETQTAQYIISLLKKAQVKYTAGIANNGIVAFIEGKNPSKKTIALRADIDALPIEEKNSVDYKSKNKGVMHACGHDAHTASIMGCLYILNKLKNEFEGTIKIIFQPAEEKLPGGAKLMIQEGVLENPKPDLIIGQHVFPDLPTGTVGFRSGVYMASTDEIYLTVKGKGGHAATPEKITQTVFVAAEIISQLKEIQKQAPKEIKTILSIGKVIANGATNIVPSEVYMEGTFRTMDENWRKKVHQKIKDTASEIATKNGAQIEVNIIDGYPVLVNNSEITEKAISFAQDFLGSEKVQELPLRMTAEDFAYYSQEIPATFYRLGTTKKGTEYIPLHSPYFDIDEESLKIGMGTMAYIAMNFMIHTNTKDTN